MSRIKKYFCISSVILLSSSFLTLVVTVISSFLVDVPIDFLIPGSFVFLVWLLVGISDLIFTIRNNREILDTKYMSLLRLSFFIISRIVIVVFTLTFLLGFVISFLTNAIH